MKSLVRNVFFSAVTGIGLNPSLISKPNSHKFIL